MVVLALLMILFSGAVVFVIKNVNNKLVRNIILLILTILILGIIWIIWVAFTSGEM